MKYINKNIFEYYNHKKPTNVTKEKFGWILAGVPSIDMLGCDDQQIKNAYNESNNVGYYESSDVEKGQFLFYDSYIAGYSEFLLDAITFTEGTYSNPLTISMAGSTNATINLAVDMANASTYGWNINGCYLFFVKYNDDIESVDELGNFFKTIFVGDSNNSSSSNIYYYKPTKTGDISSLDKLTEIIKEGKEFINRFIDKVYIAYDVNTNNMINAYNFSGFSVGESTLSISGFYI